MKRYGVMWLADGSWDSETFTNKVTARKKFDSLLLQLGPSRLRYRCLLDFRENNILAQSGKI